MRIKSRKRVSSKRRPIVQRHERISRYRIALETPQRGSFFCLSNGTTPQWGAGCEKPFEKGVFRPPSSWLAPSCASQAYGRPSSASLRACLSRFDPRRCYRRRFVHHAKRARGVARRSGHGVRHRSSRYHRVWASPLRDIVQRDSEHFFIGERDGLVVAQPLAVDPQMGLIVLTDINVQVNEFVLPIHRVLPPDLRVKWVLHLKKGNGRDGFNS